MTPPIHTGERIRVAFCITELDPGGAERALAMLATRIDRNAFDPAVLCLGPPTALSREIMCQGVPVTCLAAKGRTDVGVVARLTRELRNFRPHLLQTFLFHANLAGRWAAWRAGTPVIVSGVRVADRQHRWHIRLEKWSRNWVNHHTCVSAGVAEFVRTNMQVPGKQITVIPNAVDSAWFQNAPAFEWRRLGLPTDADVILTVGRLTAQKGHEDLLQAFAAVSPRQPTLRLVVIGEGELREKLEQTARHLGIADRVRFPGRSNELPSLYGSSRVMVLPSLWEGMPNVVLEAMAARCPVVATDVEGVGEILGASQRGLVVPRRSPAALAAAIEETLDDRPAALQRAELGERWLADNLTPAQIVRRYEDLYRRLLTSPESD
jgi:glycosyltransferase involved in cell wall biosynthesis